MRNPTCPAKELGGSSVNNFRDTSPVVRSLRRREIGCSIENLYNLVKYATLMITIGSPAINF